MEEILHGRMADAHGGVTAKWNVDPTAHGIYAEPKASAPEKKKKDSKVSSAVGWWLVVDGGLVWMEYGQKGCPAAGDVQEMTGW